jgi:hypothetical protein
MSRKVSAGTSYPEIEALRIWLTVFAFGAGMAIMIAAVLRLIGDRL